MSRSSIYKSETRLVCKARVKGGGYQLLLCIEDFRARKIEWPCYCFKSMKINHFADASWLYRDASHQSFQISVASLPFSSFHGTGHLISWNIPPQYLRPAPRAQHSKSELEARLTLEWFSQSAGIDLPVHDYEVGRGARDHDQNEELQSCCDPQSCHVARSILLPIRLLTGYYDNRNNYSYLNTVDPRIPPKPPIPICNALPTARFD
jgi:hypothetical protein